MEIFQSLKSDSRSIFAASSSQVTEHGGDSEGLPLASNSNDSQSNPTIQLGQVTNMFFNQSSYAIFRTEI